MSRVWVSGLLLSVTAAFASGCSSSHSGGAAFGERIEREHERRAGRARRAGWRSPARGRSTPMCCSAAGSRAAGSMPTRRFCRIMSIAPMSAPTAARCRSPSMRKRRSDVPAFRPTPSISGEEGNYTVVSTENRKMPPELAAKMQFDIDRWKRGETNCSRAMPPGRPLRPDPRTIESEMAGTSPAMTA